MKKFTLFSMFLALGTMLMAQVPTKTGNIFTASQAGKPTIETTKAVGDTLMFFDGGGFSVNPTDEANFGYVNESIDGLATANQMCDEWCFYYSTDLTEYGHPWDVDSAYFMRSTSWFSPAGQADNWFAFGPITVPATGAIVSWYVRCNPGYKDGYKVSASTTGMSNYTDFQSYIYSRSDEYPSTTEATDTIWQLVSTVVPASLAGQSAYFAFHHDATDMDVLWIDDIAVIEANNIGIADVAKNEFKMFPNPASNVLNIRSTVAINKITIVNVIGQDVLRTTPQTAQTSMDISNLENGVYFVTIEAAGEKTIKKLTIKR
jgi:hypothetical protein